MLAVVLFDWLRPLSRFHRMRAANVRKSGAMWQERFGQCLYCYLTAYYERERGIALPVEPHACSEGNDPPGELPRATLRQ